MRNPKQATAKLLLAAAMCGAGSSPAEEYSVYILTGQSNSLGTTRYDGATPAAYGPGTSPADAATSFYWSNASAANTQYPAVLYGDSGGQITTLQMQQGDGGNNPMFWGPEFGFARQLADLGQDNVLIIKASRGGGGNSLWDQTVFNQNANSGHMWGHLTDTVDAALVELTNQGHSFNVNGLMYIQGESNNGGEAGIANTRLDALTTNLQTHINTTYAGAADPMRLVVGEIAASQSSGNRQTTTTLQQQLAAGNDDYAFVGTRDQPMQPDNIHFGNDAKLEIGRRLGWAMRGVAVSATGFNDVTTAGNAASLVFDHYVPDANGAGNGANLIQPGAFDGFINGLNAQAQVGVRVEGADGQIVFADYYSSLTTSDLAAGNHAADNSGSSLSFTFVSPDNPDTAAAVSSVAFELAATADDDVRVRFLDRHDRVLMETGPNGDGQVAFAATDSFTGDAFAIIHRVEVFGSDAANTLWTLGHPTDDGGTPDFAFAGFTLLPDIDGDLDGDGQVGWADLNLILRSWEQTALLTQTLAGDADYDGIVNQRDLEVVIGNWGSGEPPSGFTVPEPGSLGGYSLAALLLSARGRWLTRSMQTANHQSKEIHH